MSTSLRKALQGYDVLRSEGNLSRIFDLKQELTTTPISCINGKASRLLFGAGFLKAELIIRQYLLSIWGGVELNKQLLSSYADTVKGSIYTLPEEWRMIIGKYGINVANDASDRAWKRFMFRYCYHRSIILCKEIINAGLLVLNVRKINKPANTGQYAFFCSLNGNNIPVTADNKESHDIISWYTRWEGRNKAIHKVCHNVKNTKDSKSNGIEVTYLDGPILALHSKRSLLGYIFWCLKALFVLQSSFIKRRWWNLLILDEAILAAKIRFQDPDNLAKEYLFHNSNWMYRPLWTYEAEKAGSQIYFYFYSTNCEGFKRVNHNTPPYYYGFDSMNWPAYLVWDDYQADFVRKRVGNEASILIVGPIWFSSSNSALPDLPQKSIAVFDVQPMKDAFYKTLGNDFDFYIPGNCNRFLSDIHDSCLQLGCKMALKRKRAGGKHVHRSYEKLLDDFDKSPAYISVDPALSAYKLIENVSAVISMPFTSTALLGRNAGKPSVYYDPLKMLEKNDPGAHGIEILQTSTELNNWLKQIFRNQN